MKSWVLAAVAASTLAACGGGGSGFSTGVRAPVQLFATGPVQRACLAQDRRAATSARCGCVQAVADQQLTSGEQRRGVAAFKDPHKLQEWRQSDRASDNAFWSTWKAYGETAAAVCSNT
ncbi:MAG: hypothetical protein WBG95_11025 [Sulfitobacter sp.]